jgi:predicted transcriptional regulator
MTKTIEITDETARDVATLAQMSGHSEAQVVADAIRARRETAELDTFRAEIDRRIETGRRLPAGEVFERLEERHRQRMART